MLQDSALENPAQCNPSFPNSQASKADLFPSSLRLRGKRESKAEFKAILSHWRSRGNRSHLTLLKATASPSFQNRMSATRQEFRSLTVQSKLTSAAECSFSSSFQPSRPYSLQWAFSKEWEPGPLLAKNNYLNLPPGSGPGEPPYQDFTTGLTTKQENFRIRMCVLMWGEVQGNSPQNILCLSNRYTAHQSPSQHDSLPHPRPLGLMLKSKQ